MSYRDSNNDEPENINSNNINATQNARRQLQNSKQQFQYKNQSGSVDSGQIVDKFQKIIQQSQNIIAKIDLFNLVADKKEEIYLEMQQLFNYHIQAQIHPIPVSDVGEFLLRNGKFIVAFIQILTRNEKKDYLKKYLYNHFKELNNITHQKQYFDKLRQQILYKISLNQQKTDQNQSKKQKRMQQISSPSSKNQNNWSTKVQRDTDSPFKSSVYDSQKAKSKAQSLKRLDIKQAQQSQQSNQNSQKIQKNYKKIQKSNQSKNKNKSKSKSKNKSNNKTKQKTNEKKNSQKKGKQGQSKPKKKQQISATKNESLKNQLKNGQQKLGSCYHYQIKQNRKSQNKQLVQVRTSARLSQKKDKSLSKEDGLSARKRSTSKSNRKDRKDYKVSSKKKNERLVQSKGKVSKQKKTKKKSRQEYQQKSGGQQLDTNQTSEQMKQNDEIEVDWVKQHLKQLDIHNIQLYSDFTALTKNDQKITQLLLRMQQSQQATQLSSRQNQNQRKSKQLMDHKKTKKRHNQKQRQGNSEDNGNENIKQEYEYENTQTRLIIKKSPQQIIEDQNFEPYYQIQQPQPKRFEEIKKQFQISSLPLTVEYIVDPNINQHGIYALIKLGRVTQLEMGTAFALSPLTCGASAKKKHINEDLQKARILAGEYGNNIAYIPMNQHILQLVRKKNDELKDIAKNKHSQAKNIS